MKTNITIKHKSGTNYQIEAEAITIWGIALHIHRTPGKPNQWTISDRRTGLALGFGPTQAAVRNKVEARIEAAGNERTYELLAAQPAVEWSDVKWVEPAKPEKPTVDVDAIAQAIAERAGVDVAPVRAALSGSGKFAGRLLAKAPSAFGDAKEQLAAAAWHGIQPNGFKVGVVSVFSLRGEARALYEKLAAVNWPGWLDRDRAALESFGVW